jgi:hypothetical protein
MVVVNIFCKGIYLLILVAMRSKALVCGRFIDWIAGSNTF